MSSVRQKSCGGHLKDRAHSGRKPNEHRRVMRFPVLAFVNGDRDKLKGGAQKVITSNVSCAILTNMWTYVGIGTATLE